MIDRLEELKTLQESSNYLPPSHSEFSVPQSFKEFIQANRCLAKVRKTIQKMKDLKSKYSKTANLEEEQSIKSSLKSLVNSNNHELNKVRETSQEILNIIEKENDFTIQRMLKINHATLLKHFAEAVAESEQAQNDFAEYAKLKISGQLKMVNEDIDDETIEQCLEDSAMAQAFFDKELIGGHTDVIKMVHAIEDRLEDIKELEQNIMTMHKMFLDLAAIVDGQGELLNSIEVHLDSALEYVKQGTEKIEQAEIQLKAARSKKCCVFIIFLIVATIITMPIIAVKYSS